MKREGENEDERRQVWPNGTTRTSPESTSHINHNNSSLQINANNENPVNDHTTIDNTSKNNNNNTNREQDQFLPIANVGRIMKKVIPGNGKISKDAKETVQECVSEFISFVTGEASDKCQREKRKTINGDDIIWAITTLGFEDYVNPLKLYLAKYREIEGDKLTNVPKQQRLGHRPQHEQRPNVSYNNVYSSPNLISQSSFLPTDQPFPLPLSQNSIQTQTLPQQDHIDSLGQW